jgi:DNA repair protein RAD16
MYHGSSRRGKNINSIDGFKEYDVVVTTYPILEYEYRIEFDRAKVKCAYCDKMMLPRKLEIHYKFFCGPYSSRSAKLKLTERNNKSSWKNKKSETISSYHE